MIKRVLLSPGHFRSVKGKCSPDRSFYEWMFNRMLVKRIAEKLEEEGIDYILLDMQDDSVESLTRRAAEANAFGKNCLYVSIHSNAAGDGSKWMNARGWCCYTSPGQTKADPIAEIFMEEAGKILPQLGCKVRKYSEKKYSWEDNFTVLTRTVMPAVLTENLFYDNKADLEVLKSEKGVEALATIHLNAIKRVIAEGM